MDSEKGKIKMYGVFAKIYINFLNKFNYLLENFHDRYNNYLNYALKNYPYKKLNESNVIIITMQEFELLMKTSEEPFPKFKFPHYLYYTFEMKNGEYLMCQCVISFGDGNFFGDFFAVKTILEKQLINKKFFHTHIAIKQW